MPSVPWLTLNVICFVIHLKALTVVYSTSRSSSPISCRLWLSRLQIRWCNCLCYESMATQMDAFLPNPNLFLAIITTSSGKLMRSHRTIFQTAGIRCRPSSRDYASCLGLLVGREPSRFTFSLLLKFIPLSAAVTAASTIHFLYSTKNLYYFAAFDDLHSLLI